MNVYQLIYTKFEEWSHSPFRKSGFHTAYYSKDILTSDKIMELEKWMVFPARRAWMEKDIVFFTEIEGQQFMVILHSHYLPEARDHTGRTGIYLCQGLLFPPEAWKPMKDPLQLLDFIKEKGLIFSDREAVLESHLIDRDTGDLHPLNIPDEEVINQTRSLPEFTDFEYGIISLILKCLTNEFTQHLFLQGSPERVSSIMRRILTFLPVGFKSMLGWDPDFRREVFSPHPARIIGVGRWPPKEADPIILELQKEDIFQTLSKADANSTFIRWITAARSKIQTFKQIELGYQLSQIMDYGQKFEEQDYSEVLKGFVTANNNQISRLFIKKSQEKFALDMGSSDLLSQYFNAQEKLLLIINDLPNNEFYAPLERLIFDQKKKITLPPGLKDQAPPKLVLLGKIQQKEQLSTKDLEILETKDIYIFIEYLLVCLDLSQNRIMQLVEEYPEVLEKFLIRGQFKNNQLKNLVFWAKGVHPPEGNFPYIGAYLFPRLGLSETVLRDKKAMAAIYECMQDLHHFNTVDFETVGLEDKKQFYSPKVEKKGPDKSRLRKFLGM